MMKCFDSESQNILPVLKREKIHPPGSKNALSKSIKEVNETVEIHYSQGTMNIDTKYHGISVLDQCLQHYLKPQAVLLMKFLTCICRASRQAAPSTCHLTDCYRDV